MPNGPSFSLPQPPSVTRFFDGLDVMPPGVVPISEWDLGDAMDATVGDLVGYSGIGRKP